MWEPRRLTTLWAFKACYRDSFTFFFTLYQLLFLDLHSTGLIFPISVWERTLKKRTLDHKNFKILLFVKHFWRWLNRDANDKRMQRLRTYEVMLPEFGLEGPVNIPYEDQFTIRGNTKFRFTKLYCGDVQNYIYKDTKSALNSGNACCHSVQYILSSRPVSGKVNMRTYKTIIFLSFCMDVKLCPCVWKQDAEEKIWVEDEMSKRRPKKIA
jgi:hypothetical protein